MELSVRVARLNGRSQELCIEDGSTIQDVLNVADERVSSSEYLKWNGEEQLDFTAEVDDNDTLIIVPKAQIKGN